MRNGDVVTNALLESDRDLVVAATTAYIRGARYAAENQEEVVAWAVEQTGATQKGATAVWEEFVVDQLVNLDYVITQEQLEFSQEISVSSGDLDEVLPYDEFADSSLAEEALAACDMTPWRVSGDGSIRTRG